jgi:hypothetical protein
MPHRKCSVPIPLPGELSGGVRGVRGPNGLCLDDAPVDLYIRKENIFFQSHVTT